MNRFLLCIVLFAIIYNCKAQTSLGFAISDDRKSVQIPFELNNNLVVIPVVLNGMLPLKFILDTGVRTSILTDKGFSDILNLSYNRKYTFAGPGAEKIVEAYITNNVTLDLPGIHGEGHAILVLAEDYLQLKNYLGNEVHGILGYELFSRFVIKIDYENRILTVMQPEKFHASRGYQKIPIQVEDTKPYIMAEIVQADSSEIPARLLMDSGASHAVMLESTSDKKIKVPNKYLSSQIGRGLGGEISGKIGRIKALKIGTFNIHSPIATYPDPNSYVDSLKIGNIPRNGSIGGEILCRFTVIFNFPREEVYLKKNPEFKKAFHFNLSGLTVKAIGPLLNSFEIVDVRKGSIGYEVGLQSGDLIMNINGISAASMTLNDVIGYFNMKAGRSIYLEIIRQGKLYKKEFRLKDQI
jgi:hypothetical protein